MNCHWRHPVTACHTGGGAGGIAAGAGDSPAKTAGCADAGWPPPLVGPLELVIWYVFTPSFSSTGADGASPDESSCAGGVSGGSSESPVSPTLESLAELLRALYIAAVPSKIPMRPRMKAMMTSKDKSVSSPAPPSFSSFGSSTGGACSSS